MSQKNKAFPWPFSIPEKALKGPLTRDLRLFLERSFLPETPSDYEDLTSRYSNVRGLLDTFSKYDASFVLGMMLIQQGAPIEGHLFCGKRSQNIGDLLHSMNLVRAQFSYPEVDFKSLIESTAALVFSPGFDSDDTHADCWLDGAERRKEYVMQLGDLVGLKLYAYEREGRSNVMMLGAMAHHTGHAFPVSKKHPISPAMLEALIDLRRPLVERKQGIFDFCNQKIMTHGERWESKERFAAEYLQQLINLIAPMAVLFGQDVLEVTQSVGETLRFLFLEVFTESDAFRVGGAKPFEAALKVVLMNLLWNHPEHWDTFGLVEADLLGIEILELYETEFRSRQTAVGYLAYFGFIPRDGTGGTFAGIALKKIGKQHDLFNPNHITRRWGTCNPFWVKNVVDFAPAAEKINYLIDNEHWHPALEGDRVANLFGESAALACVMSYIQKGGNANHKRAIAALTRYPLIIENVLPQVTKRSEAGRLATLTTLKKDQLETLPEGLIETIFLADLGL